jgi:hypothetical protein
MSGPKDNIALCFGNEDDKVVIKVES